MWRCDGDLKCQMFAIIKSSLDSRNKMIAEYTSVDSLKCPPPFFLQISTNGFIREQIVKLWLASLHRNLWEGKLMKWIVVAEAEREMEGADDDLAAQVNKQKWGLSVRKQYHAVRGLPNLDLHRTCRRHCGPVQLLDRHRPFIMRIPILIRRRLLSE